VFECAAFVVGAVALLLASCARGGGDDGELPFGEVAFAPDGGSVAPASGFSSSGSATGSGDVSASGALVDAALAEGTSGALGGGSANREGGAATGQSGSVTIPAITNPDRPDAPDDGSRSFLDSSVLDALTVDAAMPPSDGPAGDTPGAILGDGAFDTDSANAAGDDGGADQTNPAMEASASPASPGDLLITEIMFAPWGPEPLGEWFEIYNASSEPKLLSGLTIEDGYPHTHVVGTDPPIVAPPQSYVLFVRNRAIALTDVVPEAPIVYEYGAGIPMAEGVQLENDGSGALSLWSGATELAQVSYGPWGLLSYGQSIEVDALSDALNDDGASWCLARNPWAAGSDDGTPGADNDCP
jgi:hypothetical protein